MTYEFKHPNYYKNLRKLARLRNSDQAISLQSATAASERAPGSGQNCLKQNPADRSGQLQAASAKHQAPSDKHQALKLSNQPQASSAKRQASQPE